MDDFDMAAIHEELDSLQRQVNQLEAEIHAAAGNLVRTRRAAIVEEVRQLLDYLEVDAASEDNL